MAEDGLVPVPPTTGHYAEPSAQPMNNGMNSNVTAGHIATMSSASNVDFEPDYDSMYGRGTGQTAGHSDEETAM